MKRDNDFIRGLLFEFENESFPSKNFIMTLDSSDEDLKWLHHAQLLSDAGYLSETRQANGRDLQFRLTNSGHDFIEAIRSDTAWNRVKKTTSKAGGVTLKMLFDVSVALAKKELEEKTGLTI